MTIESLIDQAYRHQSAGDLSDALFVFLRAVDSNPTYAPALNGCGLVLTQLGRYGEALAYLQRASQHGSHYPQIQLNIGNVYFEQGDYVKAIEAYSQAIQIDPSYAEGFSNLGAALREKLQLESAIPYFVRAVKLRPDYFDAHHNLATTYMDVGRPALALETFSKAHALRPDDAEVLAHIIHLKQHLCEWSHLDQQTDLLVHQLSQEDLNRSQPVPPFVLVALHDTVSSKLQLRTAQAWTDGPHGILARYHDVPAFSTRSLHVSSSERRARVRLGYLSADYRQHPTVFLIAEVLEAHSRQDFEVFAYSYGPNDQSRFRRKIETNVDCFRDVANSTFEEAARIIRADEIDILIDLKGLTQYARTEILAYRAAPLQVNYLGYPSTMGTKYVDYVIVDSYVVPSSQQSHFTEKLVAIDGCYQANERLWPLDYPPPRSSLELPENAFVFCGFNNSFKISQRIFGHWMECLRAVPDSVLWLLETNASMKENLRHEASLRGIRAERLVFAKSVAREEHVCRMQHADLFLDTYPYSGHTTASDALRAGVPLLTLVGDTFASRVAGSLLTSLNLTELITDSHDAYLERALSLALHRGELATLRTKLANNLLSSELFDPVRFAKKLEAIYQTMIQKQK